RIKTEAAQVAQTAGATPFVLSAMSLACIFDYHQSSLSRDFHNRIHVGALSIQVNRNDCLGPVRKRSLDFRCIHRERLRLNVDEHAARAGIVNCRRGGYEREGHSDHFIARANAGSKQRQVQGAGPRVDAYCVLRPAMAGEFLLERRHFLAQSELRRFQDMPNRGGHFLFDTRILSLEIYEWNRRTALSNYFNDALLRAAKRIIKLPAVAEDTRFPLCRASSSSPPRSALRPVIQGRRRLSAARRTQCISRSERTQRL